MNSQNAFLEALKQFDTPSITNVVATYPEDTEYCLGLYHPWHTNWYTDERLKCMYPELGRTVGRAVTVTFGLPDPGFTRLSFLDLYRAIEKMEKVRKAADHVELSAQPEFLEIFSRCMRFKA